MENIENVEVDKFKNETIFTKKSSLKLLSILIPILCWIVGFTSRLYAVIRFESIIHEFDPWFNYRSTEFLSNTNFYEFLNWFDDKAWYPLGRIVGGTLYPGIMLTSVFVFKIFNFINFPIHIRDICVFLAPFFSGCTGVAVYAFSKELFDTKVALFATFFITIAPGYISRSVAGSYDNEGIAIFCLIMCFYSWIKAMKSGSIFISTVCALCYLYMVSAWGGYVYVINLIPLHVLFLIIMGKYNEKLYISYSTFYILGLLLSMQIPFVNIQPSFTSEHMASGGIFVLLQFLAFYKYITSKVTTVSTKTLMKYTTIPFIIISMLFIFCIIFLFTYLEIIAPWTGRFYSLWDTEYASKHMPIISSVSEHQPTAWSSFFMDLHAVVIFFTSGLYFTIMEITSAKLFAVLYAITAVYFAGVMIRLMLTITPIACIMASVSLSNFYTSYMKTESNMKILSKNNKNLKKPTESIKDNVKLLAIFLISVPILYFITHCTWVTSTAYSSPSIVLSSYSNDGGQYIIDDYREAYNWLNQNTAPNAKVMAWWDYGYQIAGMGNRTTLVDNNTWNNTHIAQVGAAMASNETFAYYNILRKLDVDYVLVIFGGFLGYSGDDINKFLWMVRIAEGEFPELIKEDNYFSSRGYYSIDQFASKTMLDSVMYKLSYYRFGELSMGSNVPTGYDRVRNVEIGCKDITLNHMKEAFTSTHWMVRIYSVNDLPNFSTSHEKSFDSRKVAFDH
ncbi:hypothetical protein A3Q56_00043 [Intoshia linei]|uniref:dolichyl-diphosphooligosaccharide--protein glycotransferase n=1 Tax=Intoshia linei TaxID=1819745 RepID=A0A177BFA1_9BILA|nr:hypothetical protein A3Q56_00043 [Intoshia linei]